MSTKVDGKDKYAKGDLAKILKINLPLKCVSAKEYKEKLENMPTEKLHSHGMQQHGIKPSIATKSRASYIDKCVNGFLKIKNKQEQLLNVEKEGEVQMPRKKSDKERLFKAMDKMK